jgi:hypothetical protein
MTASTAMRRIGAPLARISPRHRRWRRLLSSLTLDPDRLPRPVPPPDRADFVICGSPRTGTALATAVLYQPPSVVTVMEPWDGMRLPPDELFASLRAEIAGGSLQRGRLDVAALEARGEVGWCRDGEITSPVPTSPGFRLGVKWPAFWRYLDLLPETQFVVCLRHPVETISSYKRQGGRLGEGLDYDVEFNREMNRELTAATADAAVRRVLLYDYINTRVVPHLDRPNVFTLRYERWFDDRKRLLDELGAFLGVDLSSSRAVIRRPPAPEANLDERELALIEQYCGSTDALGYSLDRSR